MGDELGEVGEELFEVHALYFGTGFEGDESGVAVGAGGWLEGMLEGGVGGEWNGLFDLELHLRPGVFPVITLCEGEGIGELGSEARENDGGGVLGLVDWGLRVSGGSLECGEELGA